jgi:hypothetical protein
LTSPAAEVWWREQAKRVLALGVAGIEADDGDGYYIPDRVRLADGRSGGEAAWELGTLHRRCLQRTLDEVHPGEGVLFGRSGWSGQHAYGHTWGGDQVSDFWSLRALVVALLSGALTAVSNVSHDIGGYLAHRLVERCPPELPIRWLQFGCFTPLMHAHSRMDQEPWRYGSEVMDLYRAYVLLHEQLVPYTRAAAATARRTGLPIMRPLCLLDPSDPRGWTVGTPTATARRSGWRRCSRTGRARGRCRCPAASGSRRGTALWRAVAVRCASRRRWSACRCGCARVRSSSPTRRRTSARGWGTRRSRSGRCARRCAGRPRLGRAVARLADGTRIGWRDGRWELPAGREVTVATRVL